MRKITSVLLALAMALSFATPALAAGTTLTVNAPDTLPKAGETFTVTVDISGNPGLCAVQYTLGFDKSVVQCTEVKVGSILAKADLKNANEAASDGARIAAASLNAVSGDGTFGTFTFTAQRDITEWDFSIDVVKLNDASNNSVPFTVKNATQVDNQAAPTTPVTPTQQEATTAELFGTGSFTDVPAGFWGTEFIGKAVEKGLFTGYPDGTFHPNATISRADFVTVLWRAAGSPEPKTAAAFADVAPTAYYAKAVAWAKENGYVDGTSATTFAPTGELQRQAAMKILYYYNGGTSGEEMLFADEFDKAFTDSASIASWAKVPMCWACYNEIISGVGNGRLSPLTSATRAQMAKILVNYLDNN